ncbi:MAG: tetratricopeptide repeat protein [Treponema sp.]|nr:tetratricopeptide repeat protein [Treponema sp.]
MSDVNTLLNRAKSALIARDYSLAAKIYKNLILEEPENISYKMELGNLYVKAGKDDQALTIFNQIQKTDSENLDALIAVAGIYRRQKKYEESIGVLEQALVTCEENPKSRAKISYNLGFTYRQMGNYNDAINCFEEVVEENPSDVLANNHLGAIYALQGKHDKAIEAYNRGLKYDINHPILQFNIAKSYAEIGEITKAQTFFEGALRAKPGWTEAIEAYADLLLGENKVNEADEVVTQALKINPDDVKMHTAKGNVYNRQSIYEDAENEYKKALNGDNEYKNALTGLAHSLEKQGKMDEAIETISKAENLNPKDTKILKQSAYIHLSADKLDEAYSRIEKLQKVDKNDLQTLNLLGQYYICNDQADKAENCFASIKKINPDYNEVYRDWGERFIQKGDEKKAEPYLHAAIQKNPSDSQAMVSLGKMYESQKQLGKALQFYKKASNADSYNHQSKKASERITGDEEVLPSIDFSPAASNIDYDSFFSGGKISENSSENSALDNGLENTDSLFKNPAVSEEEEVPLTKKDDVMAQIKELDSLEEISLAKDDSGFLDTPEEVQTLPEEKKGPEDDVNDESFDFDQFGMEELAKTDSVSDNVSDIADILESGENALEDGKNLDFDELIDDGAPIDEEDDASSSIAPLPDGSEVIEDSSNTVLEVETPQAAKREISDDSLNRLEEQIKRASELAEKANYAAESAWAAASQAADSAQAAEEAKKMPAEEEVEEDIPAEVESREEELSEQDVEDRIEEELSQQEMEEIQTADEGEELSDDDFPIEDEILDEDIMEEIPDYLKDENGGSEADTNREVQMEENEIEKPKAQIDDVTLRRAIDMLPSIIAAIEDRSLLYRFRSFLSMFKTLREMLEYLPQSQRREFMTSRNRLLLDYVISKLSGKPGLFATTKALIRSGLIHENPENKASEKEGIELVKEVLDNLRSLSESLEDDTLREVLNKEADSLSTIL